MNDKLFYLDLDYKHFKVIKGKDIGDTLYYRNKENEQIYECKICYYRYKSNSLNGVSLTDYIPYVGINIATLGKKEICIKTEIIKRLYYSIEDAIINREVRINDTPPHISSVICNIFAKGCVYKNNAFYGYRPCGNKIVCDRIGIPKEHSIYYFGDEYCVQKDINTDLDYKYYPIPELAVKAIKDSIRVVTFEDEEPKEEFQEFNLMILNKVVIIKSKEQLDEIQKFIDNF